MSIRGRAVRRLIEGHRAGQFGRNLMLKIVGIIAAILIVGAVGLVAYASTRPDSFRVQRSATIKAPADRIFPLINDYRNWRQWSPYENRDPEMKRSYSGAPS